MTGNETILQYLTNVPAWYLATSVNDQPHVRPFSFAAEQDGKIWFVTATTKDVWEELQQNQKFEASSWWPGHGWLIIRGKAGLEDKANADMRYAGYAHLCSLGESYDGPDDPTLVFFSVEEPEAWYLQPRGVEADRAVATSAYNQKKEGHGFAPCPSFCVPFNESIVPTRSRTGPWRPA